MFAGSTEKRHREFGQAVFSAIILSALQPCLELSLYDFRTLRKGVTWLSLIKANIVNIIRFMFMSFSVLCLLSKEGLASNHFQYYGYIGFPYLIFYTALGLWPFIHIRLWEIMPFFAMIWHIPGIRWFFGPSTFTGGTAFLAENFLHVIKYTVFWILPFSTKLAFWFFGVIPIAVQSSQFLNMIDTRPLYFYDFAIIQDHGNIFLKLLYWIPIFILWFFDTQVFFILWGSLWATLVGYLRRIGYVHDISTIQKRLLPLITSGPLFRKGVGAMAVPMDRIAKDQKEQLTVTAQSNFGPNSVSQRLKRSTSYSSAGLRTPHPGLTGLTPLSNKRNSNMTRVEYTNNSDPYAKMSQNMNSAALARSHYLALAGPIDEQSRYRKCFGFVWNEIMNTWRQEDVISNEELSKLQFNELPAFLSETATSFPQPTTSSCTSLGLQQWSRLRSHELSPIWDRSTVRLPVYVYSDLILSFLKACENYQLQLDGDDLRIRSRGKIAEGFFKEFLSSDPLDQLTTNMRSCLPLEGLREVIQAFFMYLSRYFVAGSLAVEAIEQLWEWIRADPSRLESFDLLVLRELRSHLTKLLTIAQSTRDIISSESARKEIEAEHQAIKDVCYLISA